MRPLNVLRYFLQEAFSNLWTNRLNNFVSISIITFSLFTFGLFLLTAGNLSKLIGRWTENIQVNVFLQKGTAREDVKRLESIVKSSASVARFTYISEEEALRRFHTYYPSMSELTAELETNPFPPSYEITIRREFQNNRAVQQLVGQMRSDPRVEDVEYDQEWIDRVQFIIRFVRTVGLFFGGVLMFTAMFSISNVIKLMVQSRKDEIEIMRLVGATNTFIKGPFLDGRNSPGIAGWDCGDLDSVFGLSGNSGKIAGVECAILFRHPVAIPDKFNDGSVDRRRDDGRLSRQLRFT